MIINLSMRPYEKKSVYKLMQERRRKAEKRKKQLGDATLVGKGYYQDDEDFIDANSTLGEEEDLHTLNQLPFVLVSPLLFFISPVRYTCKFGTPICDFT